VLENILPRINDCSDADIILFTTTVHGMKSVLLNIGEMEPATAARRLELAGNTGETTKISADTASFMDMLRAVIVKYKPKATDKNYDISDEDRVFLTEKLSEIKTACERIQKRTAKTALDDLKKKVWPHALNKRLDEIAMCILHGEFKEAASAAEKARKSYAKPE